MAYQRTPRGNILDTDTGRIITKAQLMSEGWEGAYVPLYYAKPIMDTLGQENVDKILALPGWDMNRLVATLNVAAQVYGDDSQAIKDAPFGAEIPVALQKERLAKGLNLTQDQLSEVGQRWEREQLQFELHAKMDLSDVQREDLNPRPPETIRNDFNDVSTVVETVMDIKEEIDAEREPAIWVKPDNKRSMHDTIALAHDAHSLAEHRGTFVDEPPRELEDSQEGDLRMDVEAAYEHAHPESSPNLDYEEVLNTVTGKVRRDE